MTTVRNSLPDLEVIVGAEIARFSEPAIPPSAPDDEPDSCGPVRGLPP